MEPKLKRKKAIREAKLGVILHGAKDAFSKFGYHQTRLEDIAAAAGFSKTALYYYYDSKEEIFLDLMIRESDRVLEKIKSSVNESEDTLDMIGRYARSLFKGFGEQFTLISSMMDIEAGVMPDSKIFQKYKEKMKIIHNNVAAHEKIIVGFLQKGRQNGDVTLELDDRIFFEYISSLIQGTMHRWCKNKKMSDVDKEAEQLLTFLKPILTPDKKYDKK